MSVIGSISGSSSLTPLSGLPTGTPNPATLPQAPTVAAQSQAAVSGAPAAATESPQEKENDFIKLVVKFAGDNVTRGISAMQEEAAKGRDKVEKEARKLHKQQSE